MYMYMYDLFFGGVHSNVLKSNVSRASIYMLYHMTYVYVYIYMYEYTYIYSYVHIYVYS